MAEVDGGSLLHESTISCQSPAGIRKLCGMSAARSPSTSSVNRVISAALVVPIVQRHISPSLSITTSALLAILRLDIEIHIIVTKYFYVLTIVIFPTELEAKNHLTCVIMVVELGPASLSAE